MAWNAAVRSSDDVLIIIPQELADLNAFINSQRTNRYGGNKLKQEQTSLVALYVRQAMVLGLEVTEEMMPIHININWVMKNKRKDKDNICFAKKFILDGMIQAGLILNDGWKEVEGFTDSFEVDKNNPRVEIQIKGCIL